MNAISNLEDLLVEEGLLSREQLEGIDPDLRPSGAKVMEHLIREGIVSEAGLAQLVSDRLRIPRFDQDRHPPDASLAAAIPASMAGKFRVVPLQKRENLLILAMTDPTDVIAMDTIQRHLQMEVEPVICTVSEQGELMAALYGVTPGLDALSGETEKVDYSGESWENAEDSVDPGHARSLMDIAETSTAVQSVDWIITRAVREGASDVHISPEKNHVQVRLRVDGKLKDCPSIPRAMLLSIVSRLKILGRMDIATTRKPQDGRFSARLGEREINIRVSSLPTIHGENIVLRLLDMNALVFRLDQLGMEKGDVRKIESAIQRPHGMLLATGPTGSGKTTTLYSILAMLNRPDVNIVTVEDPVEYRISRIRQVELNPRAGMTFASSLRAILRQDPDIVMVGEIRDSETATIAIQAALTGHLVLSTVHTNDAAGTITRLIDMKIEPFLIASVLMGAIAQRLVRRVCGSCAEPAEPCPEALKYWNLSPAPDAHYLHGKGCYQCRKTGYRGRLGIYEVLLVDDVLQSLITHGGAESEIRTAAKKTGNFTTLREDAAAKIRAGLTTLEEAVANVVL